MSTEYKELIIKRKNPGNLQSVFANDFLASHTENAFFLVFSSVEPPTLTRSEADILTMSEIEASAVAKVVITPDLAKKIVVALNANIKNFESKFESIKEDE